MLYILIKGTHAEWEMTWSITVLTVQNGVLLPQTQPEMLQYEAFEMLLGSDRISQQCVWIYRKRAGIWNGYELRDQSSTILFLPHGEKLTGLSRWSVLGDWL